MRLYFIMLYYKTMKKLLIITNIPSPYRVDFFYYLQKHITDYEIHVMFQAENDASFRKWDGGEERLKNVHFLKSGVIRKTGTDISEKFLPYGTSRAIKSIRPDVVAAMEYNMAAIAAKHWCNIHKVPYISWSDGTCFSERNIHLYQKLCRKYIIKNTAAFIASSTKTKENQIRMGAPADRIFISGLSIDIRKYAEAGNVYDPDGALICVGSLIKRKGTDLLLDALALIREEKWELNIVGEGPEEENLRSQAASLGIEHRVHFCGFTTGAVLTEMYEKSSVFILPTREDCFGLVILEAMCCGLPVISSRYADGAYDLVKDDQNGLIIDPYDKRSFADAIMTLIRNSGKKTGMSIASKKISAESCFENTSEGFIGALRKSQEKL